MPASGRLKHKVTFQRRVVTRNAESEPVESWTAIATRWAAIEPLNGNEFFSQFGENNRISVRIRLRYDAALLGLSSGDRATWNGNVYDIVAPINVDELNRELVLACSTGAQIHD